MESVKYPWFYSSPLPVWYVLLIYSVPYGSLIYLKLLFAPSSSSAIARARGVLFTGLMLCLQPFTNTVTARAAFP